VWKPRSVFAVVPISVGALVSGMVCLAAPTAASANTADQSPTPCVLVVSPNTDVHHGGTITVNLSGDCNVSGYTIFIKGKSVASVDTSSGSGSAVIALPCRVSPGTQTVVATSTAGDELSASLQIAPGRCLSAGPSQPAGAVDLSADPAVDPTAT
jgi:hypothetical protein